MFGWLKKDDPQTQRRQAQLAFDKVAALRGDDLGSRSARERMAKLCRAHLDKSFVCGAEQQASWQLMAEQALLKGEARPGPPPKGSEFQWLQADSGEVMAYLPAEYAQAAHQLGQRYQSTAIGATQAIEQAQALADMLCRYDLRLERPFPALQFLRDELRQAALAEAQAAQAAEDALAAQATPAAQGAQDVQDMQATPIAPARAGQAGEPTTPRRPQHRPPEPAQPLEPLP